MGIPSFYRWLKERYPKCVVSARTDGAVGNATSRPNLNGVEFDNLYLDMNGIIHPCFHPEGLPAPKTYEEVFKAVYQYIDRIFSIVRPRKLLFLAIDGVAPQSKMNQQRSRRFKAAKDATDNALGTERVRMAIESEEKSSEIRLDSNVITPGSEFMDLLSSALRYYIHLRMNDNLGWQGIKVILSDASVPGEGEHKIMSYIRLQRNMPGYDPNTRHCLYGLDADLIMLALATHEIHFSVLREDVQKSGLDKIESKLAKRMARKIRKQGKDSFISNLEEFIMRQKFQFVNIWILREYLAYDLKIPSSTMEADVERLIDDFVLMCLFVGNDFLPQIPSLGISEGAVNLLMSIYTKEFSERGGYLTNSFEVNLKHVEHFIRSIATHEHKSLKKSIQIGKKSIICSQAPLNSEFANDSSKLSFVERNMESGNQESSLECKMPLVSQNPQNIALGWKERYYAEKFEAKLPDERERVRRHAVVKYVEGICWFMRYYYEGVCSWQWFYPYHYAPFASDFYDINQLKFHFTLGEPLKPFDQLLAVLPAASAHALPLFYRNLMTDVSSPILDFYPTDFELDMDGKRFAWQAVCKLPFIELSRLLSETAKVEHTLTEEERRRNNLGQNILFLHISHPLAVEINSFFKQMNDRTEFIEGQVEQKIDPQLSGGMNGYIYVSDKSMCPVEIHSPVQGMKMIAKNEVLFVSYNNPSFHPHIPRPLPGVILPEKSVTEVDMISLRISWRTRRPISGKEISGRPIKLLSGPILAKLAHSLVSQNCLMKRSEIQQSMKLNYHVRPNRILEIKPEIGSRKRKRKNNKKRKQSEEGDGDHVGADALIKMKTGEDKSGKTNIVGKLESCIVGEHTKRNDIAGADSLEEIKQVKSRKRKRKSKKMNHSEIQGVSNNNFEKLESCVLKEKIKADDHHADQDRFQNLQIKGDDVPHEILETLEKEHNQGDGDQASAKGLQEINVEVGSRKKKRRPKKKKLNGSESASNNAGDHNADQPKVTVTLLESCTPGQQSGDQASAHGLQEIKVEVALRKKKRRPKKKKLNGSESALNKAGDHNADQPKSTITLLEGHTPGQQSGGKGEHADGGGGDSVCINELGELKVQVESKRKKRRSKKRKPSEGDDVPHPIIEKQESSSHGEQNQRNNQASADGLQEIKAEVGSKKRKPSEGDDVPHPIIEKQESSSRGEQNQGNNQASADGLQEIKAEVGSKKRKPSEGDDVPHPIIEKQESSTRGEQNQGNNQASADGLQEIKAEVGSKKKKQRYKKSKLNTTDAAPINIVDKLESSHMVKMDSNVVKVSSSIEGNETK